MTAVHRRDRPGHDEHALHRVRSGGRDRRERAEGARADLPAARLGRAFAGRDRAQHGRRHRRCAREREAHGARTFVAVGVTNQRETTVLWDRRSGEPLAQRLVWQDTRVDPLVAYYAAEGGKDRFRAATGLPLASYFSGLKLNGCSRNVPDARRRAAAGELCFGTIDSWVLWNLTGGLARHRCHQREPHAVDESRLARMGRGAAAHLRHSRGVAAAHRIVERSVRRRGSGSAQRRSDRRHPRRSAGGARRPDLLRTGRSEEHLRHRLFPADEHRREARSFDCGARHDGRVSLR